MMAIRPIQSVSSFGYGVSLPLRALGLIGRHPGWWLLVLIPLVLNMIIFVALIGWGFTEFADYLRGWLEGRDAWYWTTLRWVAQLFFWVLTLLVVYVIFTPLALVIAAPFNDRLAELAERDCGIALPGDERSLVRAILAEALFAVASEARRMGAVLLVFGGLLPLNLAPVLGNALYAGLSVYFGARFAALEFMSYAGDRRHIGFGEKWEFSRRHHSLCLGFGLVTLGLLAVPFVNVAMVPLSAVGGTLLFARVRGGAMDSAA